MRVLLCNTAPTPQLGTLRLTFDTFGFARWLPIALCIGAAAGLIAAIILFIVNPRKNESLKKRLALPLLALFGIVLFVMFVTVVVIFVLVLLIAGAATFFSRVFP